MTGTFSALRDRLAAMTDDELRAAGGDHEPRAWGTSGSAEIDEQKVFIKRVPVTDLERARPRSTRNHFRLPTYYSYGVGSGGFGVWRELAVHEMTGEGGRFPALLHLRVQKRSGGGEFPISMDSYIARWNGSRAIRAFMEARLVATHEVWIVLEHIPDVAMTWLVTNQERVEDMFAAVFAAVGELHANGVFHFDAHLGNVVTDGTRFALTDFGLATSRDFELTADERRFIDRHRHYDYGVALGHLGLVLCDDLGVPETGPAVARAIDHGEFPASYGPELMAAFRRYRDVVVYMSDFFDRIRRPSKRARYDDETLRDALLAARVPIGE
jgi:hypothetical protein